MIPLDANRDEYKQNAFANAYSEMVDLLNATPPGAVDIRAEKKWREVKEEWGIFKEHMDGYFYATPTNTIR